MLTIYFIELKVSCKENYREILLADIADAGFDSMIETSVGFNANVPASVFKAKYWMN
ncbi:MAG: hypothetical protein IIB82_04580 [Bacteroidetes bacterium]|nr:hypothetical protein [Bacteroidota bacterium]